MKKKSFISIYVLLLLLILSISITFIYEQNQNDIDFNKDLYNKKQALYTAESLINLSLEDAQVKTFQKKIENNIKDYYKGSIIDKMAPDKSLIGKTERENFPITYDGNSYTINLSYLVEEERMAVSTEVFVNTSKAQAQLAYGISPKFDFYNDKPLVYDFKKDLEFKEYDLISNPDIIDLDEDNDKFYKVEGDLLIKDLDQNEDDTKENISTEEDEIIEQEESLEDLEENNEDVLKDKEEDLKNKYKGILYIKGDLILETDLYFDGLLILDGDLRIKERETTPKLNLKGQMISKNELDPSDFSFVYDKNSYYYIKDIDNLFDIKLLSKKVF